MADLGAAGAWRAGPAGWWRNWWDSRHPRTERWLLTQRSVYILPTSAGWLYAALLIALLLGSINYQLNLGYLLTFVLASAGVVAIHATHATLRGLELSLRNDGPTPVRGHVGQVIELPLHLQDTLQRGALARWLFLGRHGIGLSWSARQSGTPGEAGLQWIDVPTGGSQDLRLGHAPLQRGPQLLPALRIESRFPLGLLRAWSVWRPAAQILVWPAAEADPPPMPPLTASGDDTTPDSAPRPSWMARGSDFPEPDGVRPWRRGDSPSQVLWRLSARQLDSGGELLVREHRAPPQRGRLLAWQHTAALGGDAEARLSRLCAWVLMAERAGLRTTLRLPGAEVGEGSGAAHRLVCLDALANARVD
ncbi:protein of unknown function DUF58 [Leptothrix cholodnii SP-6]|uniref:Uncharacterized protein n=1 Tax=Leptothrix cholodnii (strain ATCC 51168 / LMG 8142 / SP-6) TaxID=395495 RepID=B1XYD3_LEPCP|nr:DUF58 domain-containing protein [Leptothrix cholodnii]ACB35178.1 protein of unknown function DUF58 [Leptothrix cholodnii SP-6]